MRTAKPKEMKVNRIDKLMSEYLKYSITRVCVLIVTLTGCFCAIYGLITKIDLYGLSMLVGVILSAAFGGNYINKRIKRKEGVSNGN